MTITTRSVSTRDAAGLLSRRHFMGSVSALGAALLVPACATGPSAADPRERNKAAVLRWKKAQGTPDYDAVAREVLSPDYRRTRAGLLNLGANAEGQGFASAGPFLRAAIPDRVDVMEEVIAEGDTVGLLWRLTGTHKGNLYGIAPTGRRIDVYEAGIFKLRDGRITEGWFMVDELGLLKQLGATLPARKDGRRIAPPITHAGEEGEVWYQRLAARPQTSPEDRHKLIVARSKSAKPDNVADRGEGYRQRRQGLQHLRDYGIAKGTQKFTPTFAIPDRKDHVLGFIAEGEKVWMHFNLRGTQTRSFYGLEPTGRRVEMPEIGIMRFSGGKWVEGWYFGDELGILLQLDAPHMIRG